MKRKLFVGTKAATNPSFKLETLNALKYQLPQHQGFEITNQTYSFYRASQSLCNVMQKELWGLVVCSEWIDFILINQWHIADVGTDLSTLIKQLSVYATFDISKKVLGPVHLLTKMDKWDYLRCPIIEKKIVPCFDIGEVPKSPGKWNWNWLYFLPFIFTFEQGEGRLPGD